MNISKLFKLKLQSYDKKVNKLNLNGKISLFKYAISYISSQYHRLSSCLNYIMELKPGKQRWGRW